MSDEKLPIWIPSDDRINSSNVKKYLSFLSSNYRKTFSNYSEQYNWSVTEIEEFWKSIWEYSKIVHSKTYSLVLSKRILPGAVWFKDSELNFAENLLRYNDDRIAIISIRENHPTIRLTYKELYALVAKCAAGLKNLGVKKGCLLYTSDAADERSSVDLGGRRIIKKKKYKNNNIKHYASSNKDKSSTEDTLEYIV